jgi:hypothetical protein
MMYDRSSVSQRDAAYATKAIKSSFPASFARENVHLSKIHNALSWKALIGATEKRP